MIERVYITSRAEAEKAVKRIEEIGKREFNETLCEGEKEAFTEFLFQTCRQNQIYSKVLSVFFPHYARRYFEKGVFMYYEEPPVKEALFYWKEGEIYRACVSF